MGNGLWRSTLILFDGVDSGCMAFARIRAQNVEKVGKPGHCNGLVRLLVAKKIPMFTTGAAVSTFKFDIILCQGESGGEQL